AQTIQLTWTGGSGNTIPQSISTTNLINGIYRIPDTNAVNFLGDSLSVQLFGPNGEPGQVVQAGVLANDAPYFVDGRQHAKQNLIFMIRGASDSQSFFAPITEFREFILGAWGLFYDSYEGQLNQSSTNFEQFSFLHHGSWNAGANEDLSGFALDDLWPFTINYDLANYFVDTTRTNSIPFGSTNFTFQFDFNTNVPAPNFLTHADPYWILQPGFCARPDINSVTNWAVTVTSTQTVASLASGSHNLFGLAYQTGCEVDMNGGNCLYQSLAPGGNVTAHSGYSIGDYANWCPAPTLQLQNYYFVPLANPNLNPMALPGAYKNFWNNTIPNNRGIQPFTPLEDDFNVTNQTPPVIVGSVGQPMILAGWAKYAVQGSSPTKYAYLGQYFMTNAFLLNTNGTATTNVAGILSPYGEFFPLQAGQAQLVTMPDIDPPYQQGTGVVQVISLNADANHDGILDPSYAGPDFTSSSRPFRFWSATDDHSGDFGGTGLSGVEPSYLTDGSYSPGLEPVPNPLPNQPVFQARFSADGRRTLEDFFPVYLNIGSLFQSNALSAGISATDTNWQFVLSQADGALRFAYTSLTPTNYMNYLRDINVSSNLAYAHLVTITANGAPLSQSFVGGIAASNQGIILVEAWENTTQPLVLTIYHGTNQIAQTSLYLSISDVEQMFRYKNLLLNTDPSAEADRLTDASVPNEPDTTDKNFVFLHGYNVNPQQARGVFADMYKRMYWSGSHAKFYGVVWDGYDSQVLNAVTVNYHTNEVHACATVPMFTNFLASLSGTTVVAAHSLGNMVVLSALNDYGVQSISTYFMIDAAIPLEAIQGNATPDSHLYYPDWIAYADKLNASHWFQLFSSGDGRNALTWNNRFENLQSADAYNFYSSGEEVLHEYTNGAPPGELLASATQVAYYIENEVFNLGQPSGSYAWAWQEMLKGRGGSDGVMGSTHGGWKFNAAYATNGVQMPNSQATLLPNSQLQTNAFFDVTSSSFGNADLALYGTSGSSYARTNQNRILSDAIPALTLPVGANPVTGVGIVAGNTDMQTLENGWPAGRSTTRWLHSDFHQIAYTFTHQLFDNIVTLGGLQ
ncbi:MAG: hypothetical protein WBW41_02155, partial [Verrucomicrobiia bacterium]